MMSLLKRWTLTHFTHYETRQRTRNLVTLQVIGGYCVPPTHSSCSAGMLFGTRSPPRSPHIGAGYFGPQPGMSLKPTRRDVVLCLITLCLSYLLLRSSERLDLQPTRIVPDTSILLPESTVCKPREQSFSESVKTLGASGLAWGDDGVEQARSDTVLLGHQPGWTLMERVYVYNGSLYVVTYVGEGAG